MIDIFDFWKQIRPADHVHPADRAVLSAQKHNFDLSGLPGGWMGPLRIAPVVFLFLAPGAWDPADNSSERQALVRAWHVRTRQGNEPLPGPDYSAPTWKWWSQLTNCFGDWRQLQTKIAFMNIAPYHSTGEFKEYVLLTKLPSCVTALGWAREVLFAEAKTQRRVVICLRSQSYWGLTPGQDTNGWLYSPRVTRRGHMLHGDQREKIVGIVREAITSAALITERI